MKKIILSVLDFQSLVDEIKSGVLSGIEELLLTQKKSPTGDKEYLTRKEVAALVKVSLVTVHEWSRTGILKPYRIGSRIRYKKNEVLEALRALETKKS